MQEAGSHRGSALSSKSTPFYSIATDFDPYKRIPALLYERDQEVTKESSGIILVIGEKKPRPTTPLTCLGQC